MIIKVPNHRIIHSISEIILDDDGNFQISLKTPYPPGSHYIELSQSEAIFVQYHLCELLEKHPG